MFKPNGMDVKAWLIAIHDSKCYWCGRDTLPQSSYNEPRSPTIDHLKTKLQHRKKYSEGSFVLACSKCNTRRNNADNKFHKLAESMRIAKENGYEPPNSTLRHIASIVQLYRETGWPLPYIRAYASESEVSYYAESNIKQYIDAMVRELTHRTAHDFAKTRTKLEIHKFT